ncbi:MAG: hypothetical protein IKU11_08115 [Clostridia bacterium]|nr:hypothetical protein [Clostridia bacterium]
MEQNSQNKKKTIGLEHPMLEDYLALKRILVSPENALCRLNPADRKKVVQFRLVLVIAAAVVALAGALILLLDLPLFGEMKFVPVCVGLGVAVYTLLGFVMGQRLALMGTLLSLGLVVGVQLILQDWLERGGNKLLYILLLLLLSVLAFRVLREILTRARLERFSATDTFSRGEELRIVRLKIPEREEKVLYDVAVAFRPFWRCEDYYLRERVMRLMDFARIHDLTFAGAYTTREEPLVHYYLYGRDTSVKDHLYAYVKRWRYGELNLEVAEECDYHTYYSLLPDEAEFIRIYTTLFLGDEEAREKGEYSVVYSMGFPHEEAANKFMTNADPEIREIARENTDRLRIAISEEVEPLPRILNERVQTLLTMAREQEGAMYGWRLYRKDVSRPTIQ